MMSFDLHVHTTYSDGENTPEEMVVAAIKKSLKAIGFSDHSYTPFDRQYCMKKDDIENYAREISFLKEKYREKIKILLGIELDFYSDLPKAQFDYVIGSVHYLKKDGVYIPIDESPEILKSACQEHFGGDIYKLTQEYYNTVSQICNKTGADIIGHFDLISKFNKDGQLFDESDPRYITSYISAADILLKSNKPFEINTGAISRGYKDQPYPSKQIIEYILSRGGRFILSSDSHSADTLCCGFSEYESFKKYLEL